MAIIYSSDSLPSAKAGSDGTYLANLSTTIKSLAISGVGAEVFDLGEKWNLIDNLVVSLVNGTASATSAVTVDFSNNPQALNNISAFPADVMVGISPNGNTRISISAGLNSVSFTVKVTARYMRVRVANGSASAQQANFYVDIKGYTLT